MESPPQFDYVSTCGGALFFWRGSGFVGCLRSLLKAGGRSALGLLAVAAFALLVCACAVADPNIYNIRPSAERNIIKADGLSTTIIAGTVYNSSGGVAPDGTRVLFSTTAGRLDSSVAVTQGGTAHVTLTSSNQPGDADITVQLDTPGLAVPQHETITFSNDASTADTGTAWGRIDGAYVGYVYDWTTLQSSGKNGGASFSYRSLSMTADAYQIDVRSNLIKAKGNITLIRGKIKRQYLNLHYSLTQGTGVGERFENNHLTVIQIHGSDLQEWAPQPGTPPMTARDWALDDLSEANVTVVAKSIAFNPDKQLLLRRATFYLDGQKTYTWPYHIVDISKGTLFPEQIFGLSASGPTLSLPLYYDVQPSDVGTMYLRHGAPLGTTSDYAVRSGWNLDVVQTYNGPNNEDGSVDLYGINHSGWNAQFRHGQRLDDQTTGSVYLDASTLSSLYLSSQLTRNYGHFQLNATGSGALAGGVEDATTGIKSGDSGQARGAVNLQTYTKPLPGLKQILYNFSTDVSRQGFYGGETAVTQGDVDSEGVGAHLISTPLTVARNTTFSQAVSIGQEWVQGAVAQTNGVAPSGISLLGVSTLSHSLGHMGNTSLTYDYTQTPQVLSSGIATTTVGNEGRQRLGLTLGLSKTTLWTLSVSGTRSLDADQTSVYSTMGFRVHGPFRANITLNDSTIAGVNYRDVEYRLTFEDTKRFKQNFAINYSTTVKRVQLDMTALGF